MQEASSIRTNQVEYLNYIKKSNHEKENNTFFVNVHRRSSILQERR